MAAELAIIAKLQDEASGGIRALRGEIEAVEPSTGVAARGFANLQTIGAASLAALATAAVAVGAAIGSSIGVAAEFQDSVTILAIAAKGAGESFDSMRAAAMAVGADTSLVGVNAAGAAEAMTTLYKAGMTTGEIFGDLNGYLAGNVELSGALRAAIDGAAASELDMNQAAMLAATSLATFGAEMTTTEQRAQFVNAAMNNFVQAADASMASVADLAAAMQNIGPTAAQFGFSLQDTNTALAILSTRGILGAEAGTALKSMFVNLMRPTADVKGALSELNVSLYNADGTMRSMPAIIGDLSNALYGAEAGVAAMTEEQRNQYIATLASSYGMKAMAVLLMEGTAGWEAMEKAIASAATIQEVAAARTATFSGAMEALSGVIETIRIGIGSAFLPVLTSLAKALAELASENMDRIVGSFEAVGAAIASFFDAIMGGTPPIQAFVDAVGQLATALGMPAEKVEALKTTLGGLLTLIGGIVGPIAEAITSFISWKDVLGALAIAIGSTLLGMLAALVQAFAPIIATFAAVVLAVAALRNAWENDFLGIRTAVEGFARVIGDAVGAVAAFVQGDMVRAVDLFRQLPEPVREVVNAISIFIQALRDGESPLEALRAALPDLGDAARLAGQAIIDGLVGAFTSLGTTIGTALENLQTAIFQWAGADNWSQVGQVILSKIAEAFRSLGDWVATAAAGILNWISTAVNSIDWVAVGTAIVNGIATAVAGVVGLLVAAGTAIVNFFTGFFTNDSLQAAGTGIVTALGNAISGAAAGIASGLESIKQAIFDWAGADSWSEVGQTILDRIADAFRNLGDRVAELEAGLFNWIASAVDGIDWRTVGESIINGIVAAISAVVGLLAAAGTAIVNYFIGFFTNEEVGPAAENLISSLSNAIGEFAGGIADGLASVQQAIFDWAGVEDWSGVAQKIVEMIGAGLEAAAIGIGAQLVAWREAIFDWAEAEDWTGVAEKIAEMVGGALGDVADAVVAQLSEWQAAIFDWAEAEDWLGVAQKIGEEVGSAMVEVAESVTDKLGEWTSAIVDWAENEDWLGVGGVISTKVGDALADEVDSLLAGVAEWKTDLFDWAETEDWTGVGLAIVLSAIEGLGEWANEVGAKVSDWLDDLNDEVVGIDWYEVGYNIVYSAAEGLGEFVDAARDKIEEWTTGMAGEVEKVDWKATADAILKGITDKIADISTFLTTVLPGWIAQFRTQVEGMTWGEVALAILAGIVAKLFGIDAVPGADLGASVTAWKNAIKAKVQAQIAEFNSIGADIIAGIAAGISNGLGAIQQAIQGIINGAIAGFNAGLDRHSPAGIMIPIGYDIPAGVAVGIEQGMSTVVAAIQRVASAVELEGVKAFGEAMKAIAEGVAAALSAILDIGSFGGAGEGFGAAMQALVDLMAGMVAAVAEANTYTAEVLENLGTFVEAAGDINDLLVQTADVVDYIGRWRTPDIAAANGSIEMLVGFLVQMVQGIVSLNLEAALILGALGDFLDAAAELPALFMGVADIVSYLAAWRAPALGPVIDNVNLLAGLLGDLVTAIAGANTMGLGMLDILGAFIETAEGVVGLIAPLADAMFDIANFPQGAEFGVMQRNIETMATYLGQIVTAVAGANTMGALSLENLGAFVEVAGEIVGLIAPMAQAMLDIASFPPGTEFGVMQNNIETMAGYLHELVAAVAESNTWGQLTLELLGAFVEVAGQIAELIVPMTEAIWNIANFRSPDLFAFVGGVATLAGHLSTIVVWFYSGLNLSQAALEALGQYVEVMADIAEGMTAFIDAIAAIAAFEPPDLFTFIGNVATLAGYLAGMVAWFYNGLNLSQAALDVLGQYIEVMADIAEGMVSFIDAIAAIAAFQPPDLFAFIGNVATLAGHLGTMVTWFWASLNLSQAALEALGQYVEVIGDLVDLIADAIEALGLIAAYSGDTAALGPAIAAFSADLMLLVQTLAAAFASASVEARAAILTAGDFADAVGDILGVVEDGVDALVAVAEYVSASGIATSAQQFAADLVFVINVVVDALREGGVLSNSAVVAAGEVADSLGDVMGAVEDGVDALITLATYMPNANLRPMAEQFAADLALVLMTVADALSDAGVLTSEAFSAAADLSDGVVDLVKMISEGVDALNDLGDYVSFDDLVGISQTFATDLAIVLETVIAALADAGVLADIGVVQAGELGDGMKDLLSAIGEGVSALTDLATYSTVANLNALANQFAADLAAVIIIVADGLLAAGALSSQAVSAAGALGEGLQSLLDVIGGGVSALTALAGFVSAQGLGEKARTFATELAAVIIGIAEGLRDAGAFTNDALGVATVLAENLGDLLGVIGDGVDALTAVAEYASVKGLQAKIAAFAADLASLTVTLATALAGAAANIDQDAMTAAAQFATSAATIAAAVDKALDAMAAIGEDKLVEGMAAKIQVFGQQLIDMTTFLALGLGAAAARLGESVIADAVAFATAAASILGSVDTALKAMVGIGENKLADGLSAKIQAFAQQLIDMTTFLALGLGAAAARLGEGVVADALSFATNSAAISQAVDAALKAMVAIGENKLADGLSAKIQAFGQQLIDTTTFLALGLGAAAARLGEGVVADALSFATDSTTISQAVDVALKALATLAANQLAAGMGAKIQALGQQLVDAATYLALSLADASRALGPEIVAAAAAFASATADLAHEVTAAVAAFAQLAAVERPNIEGVVSYIVAAAELIRQGFSAAGDIGQAVAYAAAFRANLTQLVAEVQGAVQQLNALAGTGTTGTIGAALANIAASLMNTQGQFTGSGTALANALIAALTTGINGGQAVVVVATQSVIGAAETGGENAAREFTRVGDAIIHAIVDGVLSGQAQVVNSVVAVVAAAINAGLAEARRAAEVGREVIQAALAEVNGGRGALDTAGAAAGSAIIDGMVRAIANGKSRLVNAIKEAVAAAVAAAKAALGIASPSKVADGLMSNFMGTAANTIDAMGRDVAAAMARAMRMAAVSAEAGLGATYAGRASAVVPTTDGLAARTAAMPVGRSPLQLATAGSGTRNQVVIYGDLVLPGVSDSRSLLEELDALRGGVS